MSKSHIQMWRDLETGDVMFSGRFRMHDYPQLDELDRLTVEQAGDVGSAADQLLALEILFRRAAEQHYAQQGRNIGLGNGTGRTTIAAPAGPQLAPCTDKATAKGLAHRLLSLFRATGENNG